MNDLHASLSLSYGSHPRHLIDVFVPAHLEKTSIVAICHGGWWSQGRHQDLRSFALHVSELGYACAIIGTRLLSDGAKSGQEIIDDVKAGLIKALDEAAIHGASDHSIIFLGSGSGTLTALTTAMQLSNDPRVRVRALIACGVTPTLEPWEGCSSAIAQKIDQFAGPVRHLLNPMELPAEKLPPLLLIHGDSDNDVPAKLAQRLHARAIEANENSQLAILTGLGHRFIEQPFERPAKAALERMIPFLNEYAREPEKADYFLGKCSEN